MTKEDILDSFPSMDSRFSITSPDDEEYNCIAWSVNDTKQWWWPTPKGQSRWPGKYWPPGVDHEETLPAFTAAYKLFSFAVCDNKEFEDGYDKVAIYVDQDGKVTHAARWWKDDLGWSSKLGEANDICHHLLEAIEGESYGAVAQIMKRPRKKKN